MTSNHASLKRAEVEDGRKCMVGDDNYYSCHNTQFWFRYGFRKKGVNGKLAVC